MIDCLHAADVIRVLIRSRGHGNWYKSQGYGGSVVALGGVCLVMAAKTRGLIAAGTLFYGEVEDEVLSKPDKKLAELSHLLILLCRLNHPSTSTLTLTD